MKYAIEVSETLQRTIIVEDENYEKAEQRVRKAYDDEKIILTAENCIVETDFKDETNMVKEMVGEELFNELKEMEGI